MNQYYKTLIFIISISIFYCFYRISYQETCESTAISPRVTRIIHQSWKNINIPKVFKRYTPSWKKCFPNWTHRLWTDEDNRNLVINRFPWFLQTYDNFPEEIYRADVSRYLYMYEYGGIYTDLDNECLFPFEHLLDNYTFVFGTIDQVNRKTPLPENYVQNSFMYSKPGQLFWLELIEDIKLHKRHGRPDIVTGPVILCDVIHKYRSRFPDIHGIKIYDAWYFNPLSWGGIIKYEHCKPLATMSDDEWRACRQDFIRNGSYVIQYHSHIWEKLN